MAKKKASKKKEVAQFSDSQLEAVVDNLNNDLGWNENDYVTVEELSDLEASDFEEDEIENMEMVTLAYLDANCDGFSKEFDYELKPLAVEDDEGDEEEEEKPAKKKGGKKKAPAKKKGGKKKEEAVEEEDEGEEAEEEKPAKKKAPAKKKGGKKKVEEPEPLEADEEEEEEEKPAKKKGGKKKAADKKKAPAKKKGAVSIVKGSSTKKHWDSRFGVYPVIEAADEGLTFDEICEAVHEYCTEEFSFEPSMESVEASVMFVLPMFVVAELITEDLTGDVATYVLA